MRLDVSLFGDKELNHFLRGFENQIPFATAMALTHLAQDIRQAEKGHLRGALDRPTPYTVNAVRIRPATKRSLEAYIWLLDEAPKGTPPVKYLRPLIAGGQREPKRFERALRRAGVLPASLHTVPGRDARLNRFGNLTAGTYTKILSDLQASPDEFQNAPIRARKQRGGKGKYSRRHFVLFRGSHPIGVYQRTGKRTLKSILHFARDTPTYRQQIDFVGVALKVVERRGQQHLRNAIAHALRTAGQRSAPTTNERLLWPLSPSSRML